MQTIEFDEDGTLGGADAAVVPTYPGVTVRLTGSDGNVFMIIGNVAREIRRHVGGDEATAFHAAATSCGSYDEVLQLVMRTVSVV